MEVGRVCFLYGSHESVDAKTMNGFKSFLSYVIQCRAKKHISTLSTCHLLPPMCMHMHMHLHMHMHILVHVYACTCEGESDCWTGIPIRWAL